MKINIDDFIQIYDKRDEELLIEGNVIKIEKDKQTPIAKILLDTGYVIEILPEKRESDEFEPDEECLDKIMQDK